MKKKLEMFEYSVDIAAPRPLVWDTVFGAETYGQWAAPFCEGTYFEGSWDEGASITFVAPPSGDGMISEIAENRLHEFVSVRHLGEVRGGVVDTTSDAVKEWAPAYENFAFAGIDGGTRVTIAVETFAGMDDFMNDTYPKALRLLKQICEAAAAAD